MRTYWHSKNLYVSLCVPTYAEMCLNCLLLSQNIYDTFKGTPLKYRKSMRTYWHSKKMYMYHCAYQHVKMCIE